MLKIISICLLISGCVSIGTNEARKITVGNQTYWLTASTASGSCSEVTIIHLFDEDGKTLKDRAQAAGPTLPCAMLGGSVAAATIGGLGVVAAKEIRPSRTSINNSNSQDQKQGQYSYQEQSQSAYQNNINKNYPKYWPHH